MSTTGQFSSKNPTIRRILKEASELASSPSPDYHAAPLETDLFEWHFTLRGPPSPSAYDGGLYHGRIVLPPAYPLKPPSFRFLTPTGRFEVNREICLSISGHHEETWQPAWGIRTSLVAIRSFMDTDAKGQVGGMDTSDEVRKRFAVQSAAWQCATCGKNTISIMKEHDEAVLEAGQEATSAKETVPEELRVAYREDLQTKETTASTSNATGAIRDPTIPTATSQAPSNTDPTAMAAIAQQSQQHLGAVRVEEVPAWIDRAIYGVIFALIVLVCMRYGI